jgi:hypothetical protein
VSQASRKACEPGGLERMFLSQVGRKACVMCIGWVRNLVCQVSKMLTFQVGMKACVLQ